jgi:hypothetical protein
MEEPSFHDACQLDLRLFSGPYGLVSEDEMPQAEDSGPQTSERLCRWIGGMIRGPALASPAPRNGASQRMLS